MIQIKFKTKGDGVLVFVLTQTGYLILKVGMRYCVILTPLASMFVSVKCFYLSNSGKRQKPGVYF